MAFTPPPYIVRAKSLKAPITYDWDDQQADDYFLKPDERLRTEIRVISKRGTLSLSLGFAEWVAWRSDNEVVQSTVLPALEAIWAGGVDWKYLSTRNSPSWEGWSGPVLGPLAIVFRTLADIIRLTKREQFASPESVCLSRLCEHVVPSLTAFKSWRRSVIKRLKETHPKTQGDPLGDAVPREALDPAFDYRPEQDKELIRQFLCGLDFKKNPYLASPAEMKKAGFKGTPYSY